MYFIGEANQGSVGGNCSNIGKQCILFMKRYNSIGSVFNNLCNTNKCTCQLALLQNNSRCIL